MGYARYTNTDGREAGYAVKATCDRDGCNEDIDRGADYRCEEGMCEGFFCYRHLTYVDHVQMCDVCAADGEDD